MFKILKNCTTKKVFNGKLFHLQIQNRQISLTKQFGENKKPNQPKIEIIDVDMDEIMKTDREFSAWFRRKEQPKTEETESIKAAAEISKKIIDSSIKKIIY